MTFKWQGKLYDTLEMQSFTTCNPVIPVLCLAPDHQGVFVVRVDRLEGVEVHLADAAEAQSLAERYGIRPLLQALGAGARSKEDADAAPSKWRVLIVEDDAASRHCLSRLLKLSGYDVATAATLAEAERKLGDAYGHLILDLNLPDGQGTALLQNLRERKVLIRVAITTATTDPLLLLVASQMRPDIVFRKPIELSQLVEWLDAA